VPLDADWRPVGTGVRVTDFPNRSLEAMEFLPPDQPGEIRALLTCDCGTATDLTVRLEGAAGGTGEGAFTCDGCGTTHWFTVNTAGAGE
jgi:hypothetical protein